MPTRIADTDEITGDAGVEFTGAGAETGTVATNLPEDLGGTLDAVQSGFFGAQTAPDYRYTYNAPAGAWNVGAGQSGNPQYQLKDEAGNIIQWAIDKAGNMLDVQNLGAAGVGGLVSQDYRDTYQAPKGTTKTGTSEGNPIFQLIDEAGSLIEYGINRAGEIIGLKNLGEAKKAAPPINNPPTKDPPKSTPSTSTNLATQLLNGSGTGDILSQLLTGDTNKTDGTGVSISNPTYAPITTTTNLTQITTTTTNANTAGQFNEALRTITDIFKPTNDAALTRGAMAPGVYQAKKSVDWPRSLQGANVDAAATVKGSFLTANQNDTSKLIIVGTIIAAVTLLVMLFRKN